MLHVAFDKNECILTPKSRNDTLPCIIIITVQLFKCLVQFSICNNSQNKVLKAEISI